MSKANRGILKVAHDSPPQPSRPFPAEKPPFSNEDYVQAAEYAAISTATSRQLLDYSQAVALSVLPLNILSVHGKHRVSLLTADSYLNNPEHTARVEFLINRSVNFVYLPSKIVNQAIFMAYRGDSQEFTDSIIALHNISDQLPHLSRMNNLQLDARAAQGEISKFLIDLLDYAVAINASDIHIIAHPQGTLLKLRNNRELLSADTAFGSLKSHEKLINRLKVLSNLDINCKLIPQDGAFNLNTPNGSAKIRIAVTPTIHGETAILRIHQQKNISELDNLGFIPEHLLRIKEILEQRSGLILFCGAVGCGKSTTAAASLKHLIFRNKAISSVEDPVEIEIPGVIHTQINPQQGYSYSQAIKSSLRQDPDVLFVGEIRDSETAQITTAAALTGHLTISTLHCANTYEGLLRLTNMGVDTYSLATSSLLFLHQRLIPKACTQCKFPDEQLTLTIGSPIYQNRGCSTCKETGSVGTELIYSLNICDHQFKQNLIPKLCTPKEFCDWLTMSEQVTFTEILKTKLIQGAVSSNIARNILHAL